MVAYRAWTLERRDALISRACDMKMVSTNEYLFTTCTAWNDNGVDLAMPLTSTGIPMASQAV